MGKKHIQMAIAYDFDGTLSPGNMQEYNFIPALELKPKKFWKEVKHIAREHNADEVLVYMNLMLEKARQKHISVRREDFRKFGSAVECFDGVVDWFDRIDGIAKEHDACLNHFIISSGIREMIEGTAVGKRFEAIFASAFQYDHHGVAHWPALALNYTTKTQYLFRINKGCLDVWDHSKINQYVDRAKRPLPFENMIFIGDGETDVPCMRLVREQGGHSIAVYAKGKHGARVKAEKLVQEGRVNFVAPADYTAGSSLDQIVQAIIRKVVAEGELGRLRKVA